MQVRKRGVRREEVVAALERREEAWHTPGFRGFPNACPLRDLPGALSPATLRGELAGARSDLTEVLLVRRHRRHRRALGRLQRGSGSVEILVAQVTKCRGVDWIAERGKLH